MAQSAISPSSLPDGAALRQAYTRHSFTPGKLWVPIRSRNPFPKGKRVSAGTLLARVEEDAHATADRPTIGQAAPAAIIAENCATRWVVPDSRGEPRKHPTTVFRKSVLYGGNSQSEFLDAGVC
jgi:hypothetical protein